MYIYGNSLQFTCMLISLCKCWEAAPPCTRLYVKSAIYSYTLNFTLPIEHTHARMYTHNNHIAIPMLKCNYSYIVTILT